MSHKDLLMLSSHFSRYLLDESNQDEQSIIPTRLKQN